MFPSAGTYAATLKVERTQMLKRAEHRALLLEAIKQSHTGTNPAPVAPAGAPCGHLAYVLGFFHRGRRPAIA